MSSANKNLFSTSAQKGAALLTVLVAVFLLTLMTLELQYTSMIEQRLAYNDLNQLQAYYLAKSGARIGMLRVALYARARNIKDLAKLFPGIDMTPILDVIWNLPLPAFPPEKSKLTKLAKADQDAAEKVLNETMVSEGQTSHVISSEASKINLNFLKIPEADRDKVFSFNDQPKNLVEYTAMLLVNLIDGFIRESENPSDDFPNLRPTELVSDIMDWVNPGNNRIMGGDKDQFYQQQVPPYKAKRGRFFTLEELKLVRGIDDNIYAKLRPHITVYSYEGKLNINLASDKMLRAIYPDFTEDDLKRLKEEKMRITNWPNEKAFVDFISNTLGRSGFKQLYPEKNDYPFTVSSHSFVIESMGFIKKNKTQVQKIIRVGLALTRGKGGAVDKTIIEQGKCNTTKGRFWYISAQLCYIKPTSESECKELAGGWKVNPATNKNACYLNNQGFIDPETDGKVQEPNSLKVLFWQEA